jgi:hypothetical protein
MPMAATTITGSASTSGGSPTRRSASQPSAPEPATRIREFTRGASRVARAVAIGPARAGRALCQPGCAPGQCEAECVAQVVQGVRQQRQRVRCKAEAGFERGEAEVDQRAQRERTRGRPSCAVMGVFVGVRMRMCIRAGMRVVVVMVRHAASIAGTPRRTLLHHQPWADRRAELARLPMALSIRGSGQRSELRPTAYARPCTSVPIALPCRMRIKSPGRVMS